MAPLCYSRATITLVIGPHSSFVYFAFFWLLWVCLSYDWDYAKCINLCSIVKVQRVRPRDGPRKKRWELDGVKILVFPKRMHRFVTNGWSKLRENHVTDIYLEMAIDPVCEWDRLSLWVKLMWLWKIWLWCVTDTQSLSLSLLSEPGMSSLQMELNVCVCGCMVLLSL